uniref:CHD subfamily II SANT-like domain-containing protein n=1 Tax=Chenopodium quinoa TaxID=63459 RepID=A0A803M955_CHEQI
MERAKHQIETSGSSSSSRGGGNMGELNDTDCGFFKWIGVRDEVDDLRLQLFEKETTIAELEMHKQMLEDKVKRVQLKKENLEEDVQELKGKVNSVHYGRKNDNFCSKWEDLKVNPFLENRAKAKKFARVAKKTPPVTLPSGSSQTRRRNLQGLPRRPHRYHCRLGLRKLGEEICKGCQEDPTDGVPKEGLKVQDVLVIIATTLLMIRDKVLRYLQRRFVVRIGVMIGVRSSWMPFIMLKKLVQGWVSGTSLVSLSTTWQNSSARNRNC